jgi:hypothetical protein
MFGVQPLAATTQDVYEHMANPKAPTWADVWRAVEARRIDLGMSKAELYQATRISETTYRAMRRGEPIAREAKRVSLCRGLGWSSDCIDRILAGEPPGLATVRALAGSGDPVSADPAPTDSQGSEVERLWTRLADMARMIEQAEREVRTNRSRTEQLDTRLAGVEARQAELLDRLEVAESRPSRRASPRRGA